MIKLHHSHECRSMRVLWMLYELGLEFELVLHPFDKSLRDPSYLALHPAGRVPALEIDGGVIFESLGALQYLADRHPESGLGGSGIDWLNWLNFAETIAQHSAALTQQHVALYPAELRSRVVCKIEAMRLGKTYNAIDSRLEGRDYLLDKFSAVDIAVGQSLYMSQHFTKLEGRVLAYIERLTEREAFKKSLPAEGDAVLFDQAFYEVPNG